MTPKLERALRGIAGIVILSGVLLYFFHSPLWVWLFVLVGLNLLQSAFTNWCPIIAPLKKIMGDSSADLEK